MYAHNQSLFFRPFLDDNYCNKAYSLLLVWTGVRLQHAFMVTAILYPPAFMLALANTNVFIPRWDDGTVFYWAGVVFRVARFAFGKTALQLLDSIQYDASNGNTITNMPAQLDRNFMKFLNVDLPGWVCTRFAACGNFKWNS